MRDCPETLGFALLERALRWRRLPVVLAASMAGVCLINGTAATASPTASAVEIEGVVSHLESRWSQDGGVIVTETTIATADGLIVVHQLGGQVGDIKMVVTHTPPLLSSGHLARISMRATQDARGQQAYQLTEVLHQAPFLPSPIPFVRSTNGEGKGIFWASGCASVGVELSGASLVPGESEILAIEETVAEWNGALGECSYFSLQFTGAIPIEPRFDGINVIRFRESRWCRPATETEPELCHNPAAAGLTFLTFVAGGARSGEILDADIEMNGVDFRIAVDGQGTGTAPCISDLANTLTHELGHFVGLDHTCWDGLGARPVNHLGEPVPGCSPEGQLSAEIIDATMYNFQDCGETKKQSLEPDDRASVCEIYPLANDPGECKTPDVSTGGFCSSANVTAGDQLPWLFIFAIGLFASRRRSSRLLQDEF